MSGVLMAMGSVPVVVCCPNTYFLQNKDDARVKIQIQC